MATTIYNRALSGGDGGSFTGFTTAVVIGTADLATDTTDNVIRVTYEFSTTASAGAITDCWIGHQGAGNAYNFDGNQVRLTFSGSNSISGIAANTNVVTDFVPFVYNSAKVLVVRAHLAGTTSALQEVATATNENNYYFQEATSQAGVTAPTGAWTLHTTTVYGLLSVEMSTVPPIPFRMVCS